MRSIVLGVLVLVACTKPNPNVCCTDEADCSAKGIPVGSQCEEGLLCRGNQCIAQPCTSSASCDSAAPYCVAETCAETCTEDAQCPGFGQNTDLRFCEGGSCHECRSDADCPSTVPVCDDGACRGCLSHDECATGVCSTDGTCASAADIAYVDAAGSATSDCSNAAPCTIERGLAVTPLRRYLLLASGTYLKTSEVNATGATRSIIGKSGPLPVIRRSTLGPIITIGVGTDVTLEHLQISGATGTGLPRGRGIECTEPPTGNRTVRLRDVVVSDNASDGVFTSKCTLFADNAIIRNNGGTGLNLLDSTATIDRTVVTGNQTTAIAFDAGLWSLTNSFVYRNGGGIIFYSTVAGSRLEFNTIVDNGSAHAGIECTDTSTTATAVPNNIVARNSPNVFGSACTYPSSLLVDGDVSQLHFKGADVAPYDYHLTAGSIAIDAATLSTANTDFDGQARPNGNGRDVGADEFYP